MKTEHPILFSTEMVQAILAGRKTQTRRTVKKLPIDTDIVWWDGAEWIVENNMGLVVNTKTVCPYGKPGDLLWVRETFCLTQPLHPETYYFAYKAYDQTMPYKREPASHKYDYSIPDEWKPSIHMPKEAARIWLEVEDVSVERLHSISNEDAFAEGIDWKIKYPEEEPDMKFYRDYQRGANNFSAGTMFQAKHSFFSLWKFINGKESYNANPWVWVIKFKVISITGKP